MNKGPLNKKLLSRILIVVAFLVVAVIGIIILKNSVSQNTKEPAETTIVTEISTIPVTQASGETVTDDNGEQVFETVAVTKPKPVSTTKKPGILDKLFKDEAEKETVDSSEASSDSTTDTNIFEEISTEASSTEPSATVENTESSATDTTSATENSDSSTTETTEKTTETTEKTTATTETTEPTTAPKEEGSFTYTVVNGSVKILSYTGSSSVVTVPAVINDMHVAYLGANVFSGKSSITSIIFEGSTEGSEKFYLPANTTVFNSLPNLTTVTFPFETNNYFINNDGSTNYTYSFGTLFSGCPKLRAVNFGEQINSMHSQNMSRMISIGGVVFAKTSSEISLIWYPVAKTTADYIVPDNVLKIEKNAFFNNPYIESITLSTKVRSITSPNFRNCTKLSAFSVAEGNTSFSAKDGVLYYSAVTTNNVSLNSAFYPPAKTSVTFSFPSDKGMYIDSSTFCGNPYLKELTLPQNSRVDGAMLTADSRPINLEKIFASKTCLLPTNTDTIYTVEYYD